MTGHAAAAGKRAALTPDGRSPERHGQDTAMHHMSSDVPRANAHEIAGDLRRRLRSEPARAAWDVVCLVDGTDRLVGMLSAAELVLLADEQPVGKGARKDVPRVYPETDQERVASVALHHRLNTVPVVDRQGRLLGAVPNSQLLRILREEHVEDLHRLAGITSEARRAREAMDEPPLRRARHRLPWLVVGLLGSAIATWVMSRFEHALAARPEIVFFVPALVYLADAIGTQSEAVAVRGLSLSHAGIGRLVGGESRTGLLIGATLAVVTLPLVALAFGDLRLALAVSAALAAAGVVASATGMLFPWALGKMGADPAYGSGPLATIIQDVLTLLIYFSVVSIMLL